MKGQFIPGHKALSFLAKIHIKKIPAHNMIKYHMGLGRVIRNEWGLWSADSELFKYFHDLGIWHADDMSGIILTSLWRDLHNCFIDLDEQVESYKEYWRKHGKN